MPDATPASIFQQPANALHAREAEGGRRKAEDEVKQPDNDPRNTSFTAILVYVLGFMGTMALLALAAAWTMRHC